MALNWGIEKVKNWEEVSMADKNGIEGAKTNRLIWATMAIDMGEITEKNVDEFWSRFATVQKDYAIYWWKPEDEKPSEILITREDIVRRIGLWTNVATLPRKKWEARVRARNNRML